MYQIEDIRSLHLEGTSRCNADCKMCMRQYLPQPGWRVDDMPVGEVLNKLGAPFLSQLDSLLFCGNYGDPACIPDLPTCVENASRFMHSGRIVIETNGGVGKTTFWEDLAQSSDLLEVVFNIDGLSDTLHKYRVNVRYTDVIWRAENFIKAGGRAIWAFLVFAHNEHQIDEAREVASHLGFSDFQVRISDRFRQNDGTRLNEYNGVRPPLNEKYRYPEGLGERAYRDELVSSPIRCKACANKSIYIDSTGTVFPCCFAASIRETTNVMGAGMVKMKLELLSEEDYPSLRTKTLKEIVGGPFFKWFDEVFPFPYRRPLVCSAVCGVGNFKIVRSNT